MGTSKVNAPLQQKPQGAFVRKFYSSATWIEGKAEEQLQHVAQMHDIQKIAVFPDLHPGKYGPVGIAILANRLHPQLVGNDIGCGMSLFILDLPARKIRPEKAAKRLRLLEGTWDGDPFALMEERGLPLDATPSSLGTIGGGNHFCELQVIDKIHDQELAEQAGLIKDASYLLVHSGSRSFGTEVFEEICSHGSADLDLDHPQAINYLNRHDQAVAWASLNRQIIAQRAAKALRSEAKLLTDSPHNLVERVKGAILHRKGAAKADMPFVPLAGSRDSLSYLVKPTNNDEESLLSLSHGAGRKYDRSSMHGRLNNKKSDLARLSRTSFGGHIVCEDRHLLIEEAPEAYKNSAQVLRELTGQKLATTVAAFQPLVTFKKAKQESKRPTSRRNTYE
ncbi:RNA ligase RtcB family protein [Kiloniella laminariae]|uniref:3'-phosphate/5'-hydroxy nucleic acid ligase n=1 Tax=Kiloniella laminariae TaxID=454162 RepID=A0ABT4LE64_9PROT|nr:RNA ligase RtcB family protein [Kiloniella laminariae]MCZ4279385.1 RNA ligase RtcB family protein [Kiloniella laminariae]